MHTEMHFSIVLIVSYAHCMHTWVLFCWLALHNSNLYLKIIVLSVVEAVSTFHIWQNDQRTCLLSCVHLKTAACMWCEVCDINFDNLRGQEGKNTHAAFPVSMPDFDSSKWWTTPNLWDAFFFDGMMVLPPLSRWRWCTPRRCLAVCVMWGTDVQCLLSVHACVRASGCVRTLVFVSLGAGLSLIHGQGQALLPWALNLTHTHARTSSWTYVTRFFTDNGFIHLPLPRFESPTLCGFTRRTMNQVE